MSADNSSSRSARSSRTRCSSTSLPQTWRVTWWLASSTQPELSAISTPSGRSARLSAMKWRSALRRAVASSIGAAGLSRRRVPGAGAATSPASRCAKVASSRRSPGRGGPSPSHSSSARQAPSASSATTGTRAGSALGAPVAPLGGRSQVRRSRFDESHSDPPATGSRQLRKSRASLVEGAPWSGSTDSPRLSARSSRSSVPAVRRRCCQLQIG